MTDITTWLFGLLIVPLFSALWFGGWLGFILVLTLYALIFYHLFRRKWQSWQTKPKGKQFLLIIGLLALTHLIMLILYILFSGILFLIHQFF